MPSVFQNLLGFPLEPAPLKPTTAERQCVRLQFITPEGTVEQATFSTTWDMPGFTDAYRGIESREALSFVGTVSQSSWMRGMDCEIINVELIASGRVDELC